MTSQSPESASNEPVTPSRRARLRPLELIGFCAVLAIFAGLVVLLATRDIMITSIAAGAGFIVSLVVVALVGLGGKPSSEDLNARKDLKRPDGGDWH